MYGLKKFSGDKNGNVAIIFAILFMPMLMLAGVGIDYARISGNEAEMQKIVDNAARNYPNIRNQRISVARELEKLINANSGRETASVDISIYRDRIRIEATDAIDTPLLSTIGQAKSEISASLEFDAPDGVTIANSNGVSSAEQKRMQKYMQEQVDKALREMGIDGNANRMSPDQQRRMVERMIKKMERQMKRLQKQGVKF